MNKAVPRIKFDIDENNPLAGVKTISLVDEPAIESDFVFFNKEKSKKNFIQLKGENFKQVVAGLALIPDKDILRFDALGEPFYGYFTKDSIERIRNKFHKEQMSGMVNTDHSSTDYIDAFLIESFIIDSEERLADVKNKGIEEATIGSWFVAYKIEDKSVFERVLAGELKGFSVEIFLMQFHKVVHKDEPNNNLNIFENVMNKFLEKFKTLLSELEAEQKTEPKPEPKELATAKTSDGAEVSYGEVGEPVTVNGEPAPDGEHALDNGKTIVVASGVLAEIKDSPAPEEQAKVEEPNAELEKAKAELEAAKSEKEKLSKEISDLKLEVEKLKKAPLAKPVVKTEPKVKELDLSKMSSIERIAAKNGVKISPAILNRLNRNK